MEGQYYTIPHTDGTCKSVPYEYIKLCAESELATPGTTNCANDNVTGHENCTKKDGTAGTCQRVDQNDASKGYSCQPGGIYTGKTTVYGGVYIGTDSGKIRVGKSKSQCKGQTKCESKILGDTHFIGKLTVQKIDSPTANIQLGDDDEFTLCSSCGSAASANKKGSSVVIMGQDASHPCQKTNGDFINAETASACKSAQGTWQSWASDSAPQSGGNVIISPGAVSAGGQADWEGQIVFKSPSSGNKALVTISRESATVSTTLAIGACNAIGLGAGMDTKDIGRNVQAGCPGTAD
eukprot:COSAG05_NODE_5302_length_1211_cov_1.682554_2_plen_293_part_01